MTCLSKSCSALSLKVSMVVLAITTVFLFVSISKATGKPVRVVSMNLCTDQLAMLIAAPDQLVSVSYLASDKTASIMAKRAENFIINHGKAEEIIRLNPDLVIAGTYTTRATVNLLRRLGKSVIEFSPAYGFDDIRNNISKMGDVLGEQKRAAYLLKRFDETLTTLQSKTAKRKKVLGSYGAGSFTTGADTLESEIVESAGFEHLGTKMGLKGTSKLPLESLVLANPDVVMSWNRWGHGKTRSVELLNHPALDKWFEKERRITVDSRYWICGTPLTVEAIRTLREAIKVTPKEAG